MSKTRVLLLYAPESTFSLKSEKAILTDSLIHLYKNIMNSLLLANKILLYQNQYIYLKASNS